MNKTLGPCENISSAPSLDKMATNVLSHFFHIVSPPSFKTHLRLFFLHRNGSLD